MYQLQLPLFCIFLLEAKFIVGNLSWQPLFVGSLFKPHPRSGWTDKSTFLQPCC